MNTKTSLIALTLLSAATVSSPATANENPVNTILSAMVKQAVSSASTEIENQIDKTIITTSHLLSLNGEQVIGTVTITDLPAIKIEEKESEKTDISE